MTAWLKKISPKLGEIWEKLSPSRRLILMIGIALLIGSLVLVVSTLRVGEYATLFSDLDPTDAGEIISALKEDQIPYRLSANGRSILVPENLVYETRIKLASAGMPRGGVVGFELFKNNSLGTTDFERRIQYNMALQGELTRTIREMREVADARVHIVQPERSLFVAEERPATASVLLRLRPFAKLTPGQVRGIAHLVASSVDGLDPENVTILDTDGNILSQNLNIGATMPINSELITAQLALTEAVEQKLAESVRSMLERVFGFGKAVVRVNADLNFEYRELSAETFKPILDESGLIRSEQTYLETYTGGGSQPIGIPGITSNIPTYETPAESATSSYTKQDITRNYELNKVNERTIVPPGSINRLTVAVWLDGALPPEQLARVRSAVESAVGFSASRGDQITIESLTFERPVFEEYEVVSAPSFWEQYWPIVAALLVVGGVAVFLTLRKRKAEQQTAETDLSTLLEQAKAKVEEDLLAVEDSTSRRLEDQLRDFASRKPQEAAKLIRTWLTEDEV